MVNVNVKPEECNAKVTENECPCVALRMNVLVSYLNVGLLTTCFTVFLSPHSENADGDRSILFIILHSHRLT